jgi:hypothetical protein
MIQQNNPKEQPCQKHQHKSDLAEAAKDSQLLAALKTIGKAKKPALGACRT